MSNNASFRDTIIYPLFNAIFYEILLSLYLDQGAEQKIKEVCICYKSKAQLSTLFQPKICNTLILNAIFEQHRQISCNINEEFFSPKITLDNETGIYTVKYGREIIIRPTYEHAENATFSWTIDGEVVETSPSLSFSREEVGEYYVTLKVATDYGSDEEEIRIDVVELEIPTVSIAGNKKMTVTLETEVVLNASVRETSLPTKFAWTVNDVIVSNEHNYTFIAKEIGNYIVKATAKNDDGAT